MKLALTARDSDHRLAEVSVGHGRAGTASVAVLIDESVTFQTLVGFGGSFTESTAIALSRMPPAKQSEALRAYFDPKEGHGYNLARTHINACDFSTGDWDYVDEGDVSLASFDISRDAGTTFPLIAAAEEIRGAKIPIVASPWSPPAWMKSNGDMKHGGELLPSFYDAWARYFVRYVEAARAHGLHLWGLTVQNEPQAVQVWESCIYSAEQQRDFVRDHLGPALHAAGMADVKLMVWDHNKDLLYDYASVILSDPEAAKYVWGTGFHWYSGDDFEQLQRHHDAFPDKHLLFTEGCMEGGVKLGSWASGERYGHDILGDLNHWTVGWIDWNLVLDETGGPNHVGNLCDAPIIADGTTGELHYQSSYYYLGHFSRFLQSGAARVQHTLRGSSELEVTAFRNPDGGLALVVMNRSDQDENYDVICRGATQRLCAPAHSIATLRTA